MKNNKIAILVNSLADGGAEKVVKYIVETLNNEKVDVELICLEKSDKYSINSSVKVTYLTTSNGNENGILKLFKIPYLAYKLSKYIKKEKITIVQSHLFRAHYVNILVQSICKFKFQTQIVNHTLISTYYKYGISSKINRYLIKKLFPKADVVIGVSKHVIDDTIELCNKLKKTLIIYNPIDINNINNIKNNSTERFNFNKDKKYLIFVGRLDKIKRIDDILKVLSILKDNIELIILGEGPLKSTLEKQNKMLNIDKRVHFLGRVENPYKYIAKSDILLLTSESESFGNVIIESYVCETPVISTKCGGPEELVCNNNGILVDVGDITFIKENIYKLLEDKSFRDNIVLNAKKRSEMFKLDKIMIKYKEVLCVE